MTFKKQITAVFLLMCILFTPALASSASAHAYDHVYTDVTVITPDSLEDVFGETEVERAAYTYEMVELSNSRAVVALEMELKIGHDYYTTIVSGTVDAYILPSGDTLYEGPISRIMEIEGDKYKLNLGFVKVKSTGETMISIALQKDLALIAFSFGDNVIKGEVQDFLMKNAMNPMNNNDNLHIPNNTVDNIENVESQANIGGHASAMSLIPPPGFPVINPGADDSFYGDAVFQSLRYATFSNPNYISIRSRVYWNENNNQLLITVSPFLEDVNYYINTTYYAPVSVAFHSFGSTLDIGGNTTNTTKGKIDNFSITTENLALYDDPLEGYEIFTAMFLDMIPINLSGTAETILESFYGKVVHDDENDVYYHKTTIKLSPLSPGDPTDFDNTELLSFGFYLEREYPNQYVGNTSYTLNAEIRYKVYKTNYDSNGMPVTVFHYYDVTTTHTGSVYIENF